MGDIVGSVRKISIDGLPFRVKADADISEVGSQYSNDSIPTSGDNMRKMEKRAQTREGFVITVNPAERKELARIADSLELVPLSYQLADGSKFTTPSGWIEFETLTTMEGSATVKLFEKESWQPFVAQ